MICYGYDGLSQGTHLFSIWPIPMGGISATKAHCCKGITAPYGGGVDGDGFADPGGVIHIGDDPGAVVGTGGAARLGAGQIQGEAVVVCRGQNFTVT